MIAADRARKRAGSPEGAGILARLALRAIRDYQLVNAGRPKVCAYDESCSNYALRQIRERGLPRGAWSNFPQAPTSWCATTTWPK